jgi:ABC-type antimicrobial peptide transport system permease subunit
VGMQKQQIIRVTLYECLSNLIGSTFLGFIIGFIAAVSMTSLFMMMFELPYKIIVNKININNIV